MYIKKKSTKSTFPWSKVSRAWKLLLTPISCWG